VKPCPFYLPEDGTACKGDGTHEVTLPGGGLKVPACERHYMVLARHIPAISVRLREPAYLSDPEAVEVVKRVGQS
jgi:hypothetical protein